MSPVSIGKWAASFGRAGSVMRYFLPYVKPHALTLAVALVLSGIVILTEVLRPWPLQVVFDQVLAPRPGAPNPLGIDLTGQSRSVLIVGSAVSVVLISLIGGFAAYGQNVLLSSTGQRVVSRLRRDLFRHLMRLPVQFHTSRQHGDLLMRLTGDIVLLRELLVGSLMDAFASVLILIGTLVVMLWLDPRLTLVSLAVVPFVALTGAALSRRIRRTVKRTRRKEGGLAARGGEALGAIGVLQAFGAVDEVAQRFERDNRSGLRAGLKASKLEAVLTRSLDLLTAVGVGVTLALGSWSVVEGNLSPGGLLVFLAYQRNLYRPVRRLARLAARTAKASACGERVVEVLETAPDVRDLPGAIPCRDVEGHIEYRGVSVRYPRGDQALRDVSLRIGAGSRVLIRGNSGAGKTTLISLLPRLLDPTEGSIHVDGRDIREFTLESLRAHVSMVFQESVLLGFSVRENIALGQPGATEAAIESAARQAGVLRFAADLPSGLDTVVGERGALLSGGQRQRIALARVALHPAPILILDEPFAHLDGANRRNVLAALMRIAAKRTMLIVSHDPLTDFDPDVVIELRNGEVVSKLGSDRRTSVPLWSGLAAEARSGGAQA